jgi:hypothetical protein
MADGNGHDGAGRFTAGNAGGPGRPKKRKQLDDLTLRDLMATGESGAELYITAMVLSQREDWLADIEKHFAKGVSDRIKTMVAIADLARAELVRRLRDMPG